jgi:transcriptional regulator of acetoin/glycerol metabolism
MQTANPLDEQTLRDALTKADGSPRKAAALLGVSHMTVYRAMKRWGIEVERQVRPAKGQKETAA